MPAVLSTAQTVLLPPIRGEAGWGASSRDPSRNAARDPMNDQRKQGRGSVKDGSELTFPPPCLRYPVLPNLALAPTDG
jgi:hypothetical protein